MIRVYLRNFLIVFRNFFILVLKKKMYRQARSQIIFLNQHLLYPKYYQGIRAPTPPKNSLIHVNIELSL